MKDSALVSRAVQKMIAFYDRESGEKRLHDIRHFMKVWGFARVIGCSEGLDERTQETLELSAVVHDIACPLCRKKYGNTNGKAQESEGRILAGEFYQEFPIPEEERDRIVFLVSHHHTYTGVDGRDWQILLEADFLVNADESAMDECAIRAFEKNVFRTRTGLSLLHAMYHTEQRTEGKPGSDIS